MWKCSVGCKNLVTVIIRPVGSVIDIQSHPEGAIGSILGHRDFMNLRYLCTVKL